MQLRLLEYFVALDRERHFARAAASCHVSQPTLSAGLAALEDQLGKRLVERDRRFIGLTPEGAAVLPFAQQLIATFHGLAAAADSARGPLSGTLRLGAIPASMPVTGFLAETMRQIHPALELVVRSMTSREIEHGLAAFELDAGLTYIDHEPPERVIAVPLYAERAMFVVADIFPLDATGGSIAWEAALAQPLCLLHAGMQNRRILDEQLALLDIVAKPHATADSYVTLLAMVQSGAFAAIMPDSYRSLLPDRMRMLRFDPPAATSRIGLIVPDRSPLSPLGLAALTVAERLHLPDRFGGSP